MELIEKTYRICDITAENIRRKAEAMGLTEGEILDRLTNRVNTTDVGLAKMLLMDYLCLTVEKLTEEQTAEVMLNNMLANLFLLSKSGRFDIRKITQYLADTVEKIDSDDEYFKETSGNHVIEKYEAWLNEWKEI